MLNLISTITFHCFQLYENLHLQSQQLIEKLGTFFAEKNDKALEKVPLFKLILPTKFLVLVSPYIIPRSDACLFYHFIIVAYD